MSEVQIAAGIKMSTTSDLPPNGAEISRVWLWDIGPYKPVPPKRPVPPKVLKEGKEGDAEYDLAKIEFAEHLEEYQAGLKRYKVAKEEYAAWHKRHGGAIELPFWSCDAWDALDRDAAAVKAAQEAGNEHAAPRYFVSSRTRGHEKTPNRGLPVGKKAGHGQAEQERREREGDADIAAAMKADPVFGQQELRA